MNIQKKKKTYAQVSMGLAVLGSMSLLAQGCSKAASTAATTSTVSNGGGAVSAAMSKVNKEAPGVKPSSVVTYNWSPSDFQFRKPIKKLWNFLVPPAFASTSSLSAIWGVAGSQPTLSSQVSVINEFYGGDSTGVVSLEEVTFTVSSANATAGATYTNNGHTFTVLNTLSAGTSLVVTAPNGSTTSGSTLTKASGSGDATITFSANAGKEAFSCDDTAAYCPVPGIYFSSESLRDYVGQELTSSFYNTNGSSVTLFGRFNSALGIACAIENVLTTGLDTDGLPTIGSHSVVFPTDPNNIMYQSPSSGGCGQLFSQMNGQSTTAVFTAVTGSPYYTKKMTVNVGGNAQSIYLKLDLTNGVFNMMSAESQIGGGRYAADRNILSMSGLNTPGGTKIGFEYISTGSACLAGTLAGNSMSNCGNEDGSASGTPVNTAFSSGQWHNSFELHRIFIDEANDVAYLLSENGDPGDSSGSVVSGNVGQRTILTAAGKPNEIGACTAGTCSQNIAMSFGFVGAHDGAGGTSVGDGTGGVNTIDFNGCVNVASIAVTTDDTLTGCGVTGTLASATNTAVDAIRAHYSADAVTLIYTNASPSTGLPFTDGSDIYTATY